MCSCVDKEQLKLEIKQELMAELDTTQQITKGDGTVFYNEPIKVGTDAMYIHHSTLNCPKIQKGVLRNCFYSSDFYSNTFCSYCMDDELINEWIKWFFPKKAD